ncbi:MAG: hypothetical protein ABI647_26205 [Gemmatimonadota bacterium]
MRSLFLSIATGLCALTTAARAQSISGEWDATMNTPGGVRNFKIAFKANGESVTGTVKRQAGDVPLTGTIKGDQLKFSYMITYNDSPLEVTMATTVTGDSMKGTVDFGGMAQDEFSAKRAAPGGTSPKR